MQQARCYRVVFPSLIVALMLHMWPLPEWMTFLRPEWVTLVLIYWALAIPEQVGVTIAWVAGLLLDVTQGAILGQHAVGMVIVVFIIQLEYQRIRVFSLAQQALVVLLLLLIKQVLVLWVSGIVGQSTSLGLYFMPSLLGAILWPWLFIVLRDLRRRFTVTRSSGYF
ncbi:Rod shape-determining protein MreD [hydrothermal vent metagenome]|uniref:Rod shape-determining protein MreD n=1 Tax=hydrothermal vent metagenome TaxID=652676 RepID=A0A3B0XAS8_9ZZZZ